MSGAGARAPAKRRYYVIVLMAAAVALAASFILPDSNEEIRLALSLDAVYDPENGQMTITYVDSRDSTAPVTVEVLGMPESYSKTFSGPEFSTVVHFESTPKYGWAAHPVVVETDHQDFGSVQIKTEIHEAGQPAPRVIYARP